MRGHYIAIEGIDGSGKSTAAHLLAARLDATLVREPGSTDFAQRCRSIVKSPQIEIGVEAEALLFAAARADTLSTVVEPELDRGTNVVSDRSVFSSLAYQGFRDPLRDRMLDIWEANCLATDNYRLLPGIVFQIDVDPETAAERIAAGRMGSDRMEMLTNAEHLIHGYNKVRQGLVTDLRALNTTWFKIDGLDSPEAVVEEMVGYYEEWTHREKHRAPAKAEFISGGPKALGEVTRFEQANRIAIGRPVILGSRKAKMHLFRRKDFVNGDPWYAACGVTTSLVEGRSNRIADVTCGRCREISPQFAHLDFSVDTSVGSR